VGVAVAAGKLWQTREQTWDRDSFFEAVVERMPAGYTRDGIEEASAIPRETSVVEAARALGNGSGVSAPDTVPFALWCSSLAPDSYEESLWTTAMGLGDVDTTCAIVGGLVVLRSGLGGIPPVWISRREPLPLPSPEY
jgi:ADP-ribosylglycohydrolase